MPRHDKPSPLALAAVASVLCFAAWYSAWQQTRDLVWPCEEDMYRDMGIAQTFLDGTAGVDPGYLGERWWYNPLVPAIMAVASRATGTSLRLAYATFGTHLNLVAPMSFYAIVVALFGSRAALASLAGFLFLGPFELPSWLHATYSPWLWPCNFAQAPFYLTVTAIVWMLRRPSFGRGLAVGVGWGITMLAHAAPAILVGAVILYAAAHAFARGSLASPSTRATLSAVAVAVLVALLVASPFLTTIVVHYGGVVRNARPLQWVAPELELDRWSELLARLLSVRGLFALVGLTGLLSVQAEGLEHAKRALLSWGVSVVVGLAYGFAAQLTRLPPLLPSWHFHFYLCALESVLFGVGVMTFAGRVHHALRRLQDRVSPRYAVSRAALSMAAIALAVGGAHRLIRYGERTDVVAYRKDSLEIHGKGANSELYLWALDHTAPSDVILADPVLSLLAFFAAGRKSVALPDAFSNPYVDGKPRRKAARAMLESLKEGRLADFIETARPYAVRFVTLPLSARPRMDAQSPQLLARVFSSEDGLGGYDVYELDERLRR